MVTDVGTADYLNYTKDDGTSHQRPCLVSVHTLLTRHSLHTLSQTGDRRNRAAD